MTRNLQIPFLCMAALSVTLIPGRHSLLAQGPATPLREGAHRFTLQWITESPRDAGTVQIAKAPGGLYTVDGEQQKGKDGFARIHGTLKALSTRELLFTGAIQTLCSFVNEGRVCERQGTFRFVATGARTFWRLQAMDNCDHTSTDYVDIGF